MRCVLHCVAMFVCKGQSGCGVILVTVSQIAHRKPTTLIIPWSQGITWDTTIDDVLQCSACAFTIIAPIQTMKYHNFVYLSIMNCWWKKSCTTSDVSNPVSNGRFSISTVGSEVKEGPIPSCLAAYPSHDGQAHQLRHVGRCMSPSCPAWSTL